MRKAIVTAIIILTLLMLSACIDIGGNNTTGANQPQAQTTIAADVTATYGAEQFHIQLTAMSEQP